MIVRKLDYANVIRKLTETGIYAVDTETLGLYPHLGDRLFSIIIHGGETGYYFNFQTYPGLADDWILPREWLIQLSPIFLNPESFWFAHNAKFDLAMLRMEGLEVAGKVHDTEMGARLEWNRHLSYKLGDCAKRIGLEKSKAVDEYIKKHKLYEKTKNPITGEEEKKPQFYRVPFDIIVPYGLKDAEVTYKLGMHQLGVVKELVATTPGIYTSPQVFYDNELALTKVCLEMESAGIKIDRKYCEQAYEFEKNSYKEAASRFKTISGIELVDSPKSLERAFLAAGETAGKTAKGNASFTKEVLEGFTSPLATALLDYRQHYKKAHTYYENFLVLADSSDRIHANIRQAGTDTTRFSYSEPNLQNLSKNDEEDASTEQWLIRRSFIPTNSDYCLVMVDYMAFEYRLMLEYAGEEKLIDLVNSGLDLHQATANIIGTNRTQAKKINFSLLYGSGAQTLADELGLPLSDAVAMKANYFSTLPRVRAFTRGVMKTAEQYELVRSWMGFPFRFPYFVVKGERTNFAYKAPNHLIQGGTAQVVRKAMVGVHKLLKPTKSRMLVQIHDELLIEVHKTELAIIPAIVKIMEESYPYKRLPLLCEVSHSWKSWANKSKGLPKLEPERMQVQRASLSRSEEAQARLVFQNPGGIH